MRHEQSIQSIAQMKYVIQCYISDMRGSWIRISNYDIDKLKLAYEKACEFYGAVLPVPDKGRYEDYTI